jgi:aspartyl protease family protein
MSDEQYARTGRFMFLVVWIIIFIGLFLFFSYQGTQQSEVLISNQHEFVVTADAQGNYFVKGRINNYPVNFLIDTGATTLAIPQNVADKLHLVGAYPVVLYTANGEVTGALARVEELSFGAFTLHNVKAVIIPKNNDETVLLGMNVLRYFNVSQDKAQLKLKKSE